MRFGKTLEGAILPEWREHYIDYSKLKTILRENDEDDSQPWTEQDAHRFSEELFNVQLEKVAQFQEESMAQLTADVDSVFGKLRELAPPEQEGDEGAENQGEPSKRVDEEAAEKLRGLENELDRLTERVRKLKQYSSINYTGFLKIAKKNDRKKNSKYKVRPLLNVRLAARPINSEQSYSVLLNRLSIMYFAIRQQLDEEQIGPLDPVNRGETHDGEKYTAYKFWVHPDNLLEVKMHVLRRLPALVYQSHSSESEAREDPTITSLYFDNPQFELYTAKVARQANVTATNQASVASVRVRWFGQLSSGPEIYVEKKAIDENGASQEQRFTLKSKYVKSYVDGEYKMERTVQKMEQRNSSADELGAYKAKVGEIQSFILDKSLAPVLRANYVRSAFQKPGDNRVRISIDTDVAFIREDTLDPRRPCRDPNDWHRADIDRTNATYPFKNLNQGEVYRFPFAILEIKIRGDTNRKHPAWVEDLMGSHLVHKAPMFSKFAHGVAVLFDDYVNSYPSWLPDVDIDILKDPTEAFRQEEERKVQQAEQEAAIGSFIGAGTSLARSAPHVAGKSSPHGQSYLADRMAAEQATAASTGTGGNRGENGGEGEEEGEEEDVSKKQSSTRTKGQRGYGTISSFLPNMSLTRYGINKRKQQQQHVELPEGVMEPEEWIKNAGELRVEPKVWLANERTYIKWQHISVLIGSLALALYASAGKDRVALSMGVAYLGVACFAALWGGYVLNVRQGLIRERSGKDFDFNFGPVVLSVMLMVALVLNFYFQWKAAFGTPDVGEGGGGGGVGQGEDVGAGASAAVNV